MAAAAGPGKRFVAGEAHATPGLAAVTRLAGQPRVGAVEAVGRVPRVIELRGLQALGRVAALAGGGTAGGRELPLVRIAVAALAGLRHACEAEAPRRAATPLAAVAAVAAHAGMAAGERDSRLGVVERDLTQGVDAVAGLASAPRHEAGQLAQVRILVAVRAARGCEAESRPRSLEGPVAGVAGHRQVGPGERIGGLRVLVGPEAGRPEAPDVVAAFAAALVRAVRE